jgi:hypothetical protein
MQTVEWNAGVAGGDEILLVQAVKGGDVAAFDSLVRLYDQRCFGLRGTSLRTTRMLKMWLRKFSSRPSGALPGSRARRGSPPGCSALP